jgi:hypothetical protein
MIFSNNLYSIYDYDNGVALLSGMFSRTERCDETQVVLHSPGGFATPGECSG